MGLLEWGDMYKRTDALGFTSSENAVNQPPPLGSLPSPVYNIREELFEMDEDIYFEMIEKNSQAATVGYPTYTPSHQKSSLNLDQPALGEDNDEEIYFPSYDDIECSDQIEFMEPATESTQATQRPVSPDPVERPEDDSAIRAQPSRHVDYLSHDWVEEDIWASWKHLVSKRGAYNNGARLENASWRSWAKKRSNLRTVPPETVKWMKDHDLTWLYGPLTPGSTSSLGDCCMPNNKGRRLSRAEIARHSKKPILKKRSVSEIMLRRSISSSLLLKQTVAAKNGKNGPHSSTPFQTPILTRSNTDIKPSRRISGIGGDSSEGWKKVQFHELVEQCIALANAGDEENEYHYCSGSDDDVILMRKTKKRATSKWLPPMKSKARTTIWKTIEKLPHAPLKDNEMLDDVPEEDIPDEISDSESASPSFQMDTSGSTSMDHDSDEEDMDWQPPAWLQGRKDSVQIVKDRMFDVQMQNDEAAMDKKTLHRPQLERRDASATEDIYQVPMAPVKESTDSSITFELPPARSELSTFSFKTPKYQRPRDDYFLVDPGMTEGESEDSMDMARSASRSSQVSDKSEAPPLPLDNFQRHLVDRVMSEFWALFSQQWDTYSQGSALSPLAPAGTSTPLSVRKRRRGGSRQRIEKSNYFETIPEDGPTSPDSKELADYECYIHRELPRAVHRDIEASVRRDSQPNEARLVGSLVDVIHNCEDQLFQSYFEDTDRVIKSLGILSMDAYQSPTVSKENSHHHSEFLDAAYHQPPSQDQGNHHSSLRSSSSSSATPARDRVFSDSGYASEITSTMTSPTQSRRETDASKWSIPKDVKGKDGQSIREMDLYDYDAVDEALSWASVY